jgi:hypothetical protein
MYANPILFPQISNREDLLVTVALFDDDTGQAIDISGRTLAAPGDFAGNAWTVTSGIVNTASVTALTIKDYPFGGEMQAIACTVGINLAILPGAPVTIKDATGKNTMTGYVTSYAPATGALVAQIGSAFQFEIRGHHHGDGYGPCDYGSSSYIGTDEGSPIISAQLGAGITNVDVGKIQLRVPASTFAKLRHKTYSAAMTMFDGSDTRQVFIGKLPVQWGGVTLMPLPAPQNSNPFGLP